MSKFNALNNQLFQLALIELSQLSAWSDVNSIELWQLFNLSVSSWVNVAKVTVCLSTLSPEEIQTAAKTLVDSYPSDLDNSFVDELSLCHVCWYIQRRWARDISTELFLYKLIIDKGMQDTFPNVAIALRMYLVLMVTNCSAERSFSKLKLIESRLRTSMTQDRLVNLAITSIESHILREIDFAVIINEFAVAKSRKVSYLWI